MMQGVQTYVNFYSKLWEESSEEFPQFSNVYSRYEQIEREKHFSQIQSRLKKLQNNKYKKDFQPDQAGVVVFPAVKEFLEKVFDFEAKQLDIILSDGFKDVSKDFFSRARSFAPELAPESIYQGMRNVWIMTGLQMMMGRPVEITHSVFAYSMIYPYSDNLLDNPEMSGNLKQLFSSRFDKRLHGLDIAPENVTEQQLFRLVMLIEAQYPRKEFPGVYDSLYAIQQGQSRSLQLISNQNLEESVVRNICFEKGGASVLADGFLVAGNLTAEQEKALFGYGIYLQLLDDIQDVQEDTVSNTRTLFTGDGIVNHHETRINKTINFGRRVMEYLRCFQGNRKMLELMNHSIESMIVESVGLSAHEYAREWIYEIEKHSPLRFAFIKEKKSESKSHRLDILKKMFSLT